MLDCGRGRRVGDPGPHTVFLPVQRQRAIMKYSARAEMVKIVHRRLHEKKKNTSSDAQRPSRVAAEMCLKPLTATMFGESRK